MPEPRTSELVRAELAAERTKLVEEKAAFEADARTALPYAIGGLVALGLVSRRRTLRRALSLLRVIR